MRITTTSHTYTRGPNKGITSTRYDLSAYCGAYTISYCETMGGGGEFGVFWASTHIGSASMIEEAKDLAYHISKNTNGTISDMRRLAAEHISKSRH